MLILLKIKLTTMNKIKNRRLERTEIRLYLLSFCYLLLCIYLTIHMKYGVPISLLMVLLGYGLFKNGKKTGYLIPREIENDVLYTVLGYDKTDNILLLKHHIHESEAIVPVTPLYFNELTGVGVVSLMGPVGTTDVAGLTSFDYEETGMFQSKGEIPEGLHPGDRIIKKVVDGKIFIKKVE
jgi:hypothetical protein